MQATLDHPVSTVLKPRAYFASDLKVSSTFGGHPIEPQADGSAIVRDVPVFRAGTFRDSMGEQRTWTAEHLAQMVGHFNLLRDTHIFEDVPVRRDHSISVDKLMGYFESMRTDGSTLFADLHVTEPDQIDKLARGTYRSRSLEVGMYVTNDEAAYWPVVFGVAYVDLPAVEGLHNKNLTVAYFSQTVEDPKETIVTTGNAVTVPNPSGSGTITVNVQPGGQLTYSGQSTSGGTDPAPPPQPTPPTPPNPAPAPPPHAFRVNGAETMDFAAVQQHIVVLEKFRSDTKEANRKAFVTSLVASKKIVATQEEGLAAFALALDDDQYEAWVKTYENVAALSILSDHGGTGTPAEGTEVSAKDDEISIQQGIIANHKRAGLTDEQIKTTKAYTRLQELTTS